MAAPADRLPVRCRLLGPRAVRLAERGRIPDLAASRAAGFALVAPVVGLVAIAGSLLARDVRALWYCSPRRWRAFRDDVIGDG